MRLGTRPPLSRPDHREALRLELVAVAAEVATLAARVQEEAEFWMDPDGLEPVFAEAEDLLGKAAQVLAFDSGTHTMDEAEIHSRLVTFKGYQSQAMLLRSRVEHQRPRPRRAAARRGLAGIFPLG